MAQKKLVNRTGFAISGILTVRAGSTPGHVYGKVPYNVPANGQETIQYGNNENPYLDALQVTVAANGATIESTQTVTVRGSQVDNEFNTNNTITIALQGQSAVTNGSNS